MKPKRVRAELQSEDTLYFCKDLGCMPCWKYESEGGDSETNTKQVDNNKDVFKLIQNVFSSMPAACFTDEKEHCIFLQLAPRENSKDSLHNIVPSLKSSSESSLKSVPGPHKHQDYDNPDASWEDDFKGIHEDGLHMPLKLWNDPDADIKPENDHSNNLEQDENVRQEETDNETSVISEDQEVSEITKNCSHRSYRKETNALKISQRRKKSKQKDNESISPSQSGIFQRKDRFSTLPEDNDCNSAIKSTSEIGIQVGLTENMDNSCMKFSTNFGSGEHIAISCSEKIKNKRGVAQALPSEFVPWDNERSVLKSHEKEIVLHRCFTAPYCDIEKQITVEALENLTAEDESCLNLEIDNLRAQEESITEGSDKSMNGFNEKTSQFRTDEDHNSKGKPDELYDELIHDEDKKDFEPVQDTVLVDDDISHKTEVEYQPMHPSSIEEHNDNQKNENSGFDCAFRRKHSVQMEHGEIRLRQSDDEYMDLKRRPVHINSLEECDENMGTDHDDCTSEKESNASDVVGESSDSRIKQIDQCSLLENDLPRKVLFFPELSLGKVLQEERKPFQEKNQELDFKMKICMNTDHKKKPHACGSYHEELALVLKMFLGSISNMDRNAVNISDLSVSDRNMPKEDKSKDNDVHFKDDIKSHEFALLKKIISTWYFFPMLNRLMEFCLPSSLQVLFQRLISGPPISQAERMSYEWLRLESFNTLPSSTRGTAIRLAQSGFYYTRQGTRIRCYACNVGHEGWNDADDPHELHRRISPNCPFLEGNPTYPNFPIIPDTIHSGNNTERSTSSATPMIPVIQERTQSRVLETQPVIILSVNHSSMLHLNEMSVLPSAVADGYLQVPSETVQVDARKEKAETQDSSICMKQQQTNSNPRAGASQPETSPSSSSMSHPQQPTEDAENTQYSSPGNFVLRIPTRQDEDPGVDPLPQTMSERPKHPEHATLSSRINSYTSWPIHLDQTPQQMAEAGFFYAGINDYTRCFQCGGGLRNWEPGDNPWIEHARWYPQCAYVLGKRGQRFVNAVLKKQAELLAAQNAEQSNSCSTTTTTTTIVISGTGNSSESESVRQPNAQTGKPKYFQNPNENDIANKLIEMGYQRERVREAILEVKRRRGQQEITIEHAIDLLLADEERRTTAGRQNEGVTMQELIQESGRLILHDDSSQPPTSASTSVPPAPPPAATESCQNSGHQYQVAGGRSTGQQQSGQINQSTGLGRIASLAQSRQNTSGPMSIAVDVPLSSPSFGNRVGHHSNKSTAANGRSSPTLLEPISLPALDAESLKEEYLRLRDQNVCKICMERKIDLVFLPCGHLMCCQVCGQSLRICPICRAKINGSAKTYLS
ncbi:hypothetical protein CHS0354_033981 [Potamilus streckersoni]|uniref:Uncharacterized protein n=1 Tax=Potamilus streckersoni TaxID=2493646 RepID=A0AAE0W8W3_9BIVA|nr:hypothetical protein CHS0354_033981 [Potamilus streckersoni]